MIRQKYPFSLFLFKFLLEFLTGFRQKKRKKSHSNGKQKSKIIFNSLYRKSQGIHYKTVRTEEGYQDSQIKINIFKNHLYLYTLARNNPKFKLRK